MPEGLAACPLVAIHPPFPDAVLLLIGRVQEFLGEPNLEFPEGVTRVECEIKDLPGVTGFIYIVEMSRLAAQGELSYAFSLICNSDSVAIDRVRIYHCKDDEMVEID